MAIPDSFAGFAVLPLSYRGSRLHVIYLREHVVKQRTNKQDDFPSGRTLFAVNIPPDATERELFLLFKPCGIVEHVVFDRNPWTPGTYGPIIGDEEEDEEPEATESEAEAETAPLDDSNQRRKKRKLSKKAHKVKAPPQVTPLPVDDVPLRTFHRTGSSAHIIFLEPSSLARALSLGSSTGPQPWPPTGAAIAPRGLAHYAARHDALRPSLSAVKAHADSFMEVYEYNKAMSLQKSKYKKGEAIVDEDGFTLVTRGGAYGTTLGGGVGVASKKFMEEMGDGKELSGRRKKKRKIHEKEDFYKFQLQDERKKRLEDLKANWQKDQGEFAQLVASNKSRFKPY